MRALGRFWGALLLVLGGGAAVLQYLGPPEGHGRADHASAAPSSSGPPPRGMEQAPAVTVALVDAARPGGGAASERGSGPAQAPPSLASLLRELSEPEPPLPSPAFPSHPGPAVPGTAMMVGRVTAEFPPASWRSGNGRTLSPGGADGPNAPVQAWLLSAPEAGAPDSARPTAGSAAEAAGSPAVPPLPAEGAEARGDASRGTRSDFLPETAGSQPVAGDVPPAPVAVAGAPAPAPLPGSEDGEGTPAGAEQVSQDTPSDKAQPGQDDTGRHHASAADPSSPPPDVPAVQEAAQQAIATPADSPSGREVAAPSPSPVATLAEPPAVAGPPPIGPPNPETGAKAGSSRGGHIAAAPTPAMLDALMRRGDAMAAAGDISAARLLYGRAAAAGSGRAAAALGRTYDPGFLAGIGASIHGDPETARAWHQRAVALGDGQAREPLDRQVSGPAR